MIVRLFLATSLVFAVAFGFTMSTRADQHEKQEKHENHGRDHHVITIDAMSVHPPIATVNADHVVVFVNYSGNYVQVKFPGEVASKFTCPTRPSFYKTGGGSIVSRQFGPLEFALPCRLEPGEYSYRIIGLYDQTVLNPDQDSPGDPTGKIVVK